MARYYKSNCKCKMTKLARRRRALAAIRIRSFSKVIEQFVAHSESFMDDLYETAPSTFFNDLIPPKNTRSVFKIGRTLPNSVPSFEAIKLVKGN